MWLRVAVARVAINPRAVRQSALMLAVLMVFSALAISVLMCAANSAQPAPAGDLGLKLLMLTHRAASALGRTICAIRGRIFAQAQKGRRLSRRSNPELESYEGEDSGRCDRQDECRIPTCQASTRHSINVRCTVAG